MWIFGKEWCILEKTICLISWVLSWLLLHIKLNYFFHSVGNIGPTLWQNAHSLHYEKKFWTVMVLLWIMVSRFYLHLEKLTILKYIDSNNIGIFFHFVSLVNIAGKALSYLHVSKNNSGSRSLLESQEDVSNGTAQLPADRSGALPTHLLSSHYVLCLVTNDRGSTCFRFVFF